MISFFARMRRSYIVEDLRTRPLILGVIALVIVLILAAVFAPWLTPQDPFDPATLNLLDGFTPPLQTSAFTGTYFILGADDQGRDLYSAILYGSRISLFVGFAAVFIAMVVGVTLGLIAGFFGGWLDAFIMRVADIQLSFPGILIAMLTYGIIRGFIPPQDRENFALIVLIVSISLSDWVQYARTVRGVTKVEAEKEYIQAARIIGQPSWFVMFRHILPNVLSPVMVIATIGLALAIIAESTLSFLGVGVPPTQPSLGTLIRTGQDFLFSGEWWILLFPALMLLALALSVNLLGDYLRDVLDPKLK
ncbi:MAG: ABC transporter permease [Alphaproteobacteria bacterium]|nr:ABC transporter permease [Alphaproteobacteria bacterium]